MRFKQPNCRRLQGAADARRRARRRTFVLQVPANKADAVSVNAYKNAVIVNQKLNTSLYLKVETLEHFASGCCDIDPPWAFVAIV
jgi:hypothetical protein